MRTDPPYCAFTSNDSSVTNKTRIGTCLGANKLPKIRSSQLFVGCACCNHWRCVNCYVTICDKIVWRNMHSVNALEAMRLVNWRQVNEDGGVSLLENLPPELCLSTATWNSKIRCFQWKDNCPSCFDIQFIRPGRVFPSTAYEVLKPTFETIKIDLTKNNTQCFYFWNCPIISDTDGTVILEKVMLVVHSVHPLISSEKAKQFYYRSSDEAEHKHYVNINEYNRLIKKKFSKGAHKTFVAVCTLDEDGSYDSSSVPSLILVDGLEDLFPKGSEKEMKMTSRKLLEATRNCVPPRMPGTAATKDKAKLIRKNIRRSCLKVGRKSGPHGHLGGATMKTIRALCTSNLVRGAIARKLTGTICIPYRAGKWSPLITSIRTYYVKVDDVAAGATCSPLSAPPKWGWVADAKKVRDLVSSDIFPESHETCSVKKILKREITTLFSGALVINEFNKRNPTKAMAKLCTHNTLELYDSCQMENTKNGKDLIDRLLDLGRHSVVIDATYGHKDSYNGKQTKNAIQYFQSKLVLITGDRSGLSFNSFLSSGSVPPGVVAIPRFKVFTNCHALLDIEIHAMTNTVHFSSRSSPDDESRGAWFYCSKTKSSVYFAQGCALTRII